MKIYALFTLHEVGWGTRAGVGTELAANIGKEAPETEKNQTEHVKIEMSDYNQQAPYEDPFFSEEEIRRGEHVREMGVDGSFAPTTSPFHDNAHLTTPPSRPNGPSPLI
ncbi:hypothetical protein CU098_011031 [Rhizopus stolonifer]|uniref:Uncharacterized protein n=2 Tax=Mucorineae TaxID=1344963 RepID=A0A367JQQ4_RHIST|nr:hypothetical protein CU098_011031 [Rhizopus stolonifer]